MECDLIEMLMAARMSFKTLRKTIVESNRGADIGIHYSSHDHEYSMSYEIKRYNITL